MVGLFRRENDVALEMTRDYRLRWMDFDRYGRMQPAAVLDIFQDMTTLHAEEIGIGRDVMLEAGVIWVVVRTKLQMVKEPEHFQVVSVRTWPHSLSRFSFIRDFTMHDENGDLVAQASQEWVLMDVNTRKFASAKDFYQGDDDFSEDRVFAKKARKIPNFEEGNLPVATIVPSYADIDLNGHVNNAKYANFIVNALNPGPEGTIDTLQIDYRYEALPGEPLAVHALSQPEEGRVLLKGLAEDGTVVFGGMIELK